MSALRLWHHVVGHSWTVRLTDVCRAVTLMHLHTWAGTYSTCRCGAVLDDLSHEARLHFRRNGQMTVGPDGAWVVR